MSKKERSCKSKYTSIGGQALLEGIMMRGPKITAMAVRNRQNEIVVEESPTTGVNRNKFCKLPFVRGIFGMIDSLSIGYKCLMRSADLSGLAEEEEAEKAKKAAGKKPSKFSQWLDKVLEKYMMPIATVLAVILAVVLFMWLPVQLFTWLSKAVPALAEQRFLRSLFEGVVRIFIFLAYVASTALMKDIRRTYQYHGAEHKTIFCYEKKLPLTVENVRAQKRFHPRCGTSFLVLMLIVGIFISLLIPVTNPILRTALKLLTFPIVLGVGYELIKFAGRHDNVVTRVISAPGQWIQRLTTKEPDDSMIECAIAAMERVIPEREEKEKAEAAEEAASGEAEKTAEGAAEETVEAAAEETAK